MTLLPILGRELRVASRKRLTYWLRVIAAAVWLFISGAYYLSFRMSTLPTGISYGWILLTILTAFGFAAVSLSGVFLTSDILSQEKREGTLGLLFLTDLRGYDIVLGKAFAGSLQAFYALLSVFPVLSILFLMGGVTAEAFIKAIVILINGAFFSLAVGVFISSISDDALKAINGTLLFLAVILIAFPLIDYWQAGWDFALLKPKLSLISPSRSFLDTFQRKYTHFWPNLLCSQALSWLLIGLASWITPRIWSRSGTRDEKKQKRFVWNFFSGKRRERWRQKMIEKHPVFWMASRETWSNRLFQLVFFGGLAFLGLLSTGGGGDRISLLSSLFSGFDGFLTLLVQIWVAAQASRFFAETARNGSLELLLCTPVQSERVIDGYWRALCRAFWLPIIIIAGMDIVSKFLSIEESLSSRTMSHSEMIRQMIDLTGSIAYTFLTPVALGWFGLWTGLKNKRTITAMIITFAIVSIVPILAINILVEPILDRLSFNKLSDWATQVVTSSLFLLADLFFIWFATRRLRLFFRDVAAGEKLRFRPFRRPVILYQ